MLKFYRILLRPEKNVLSVTRGLLDALGIKITRTSLRKSMEEHPNYPSMLCISDVLKFYGINNVSVRSSFEQLEKIKTPFIAVIKEHDRSNLLFCLVLEVNETYFTIQSLFSRYKQKIDASIFKKIYRGVVLVAEASENAGEKNYLSEYKKERNHRLGLDISLLFVPSVVLLCGLYYIIWEASYIPVFYSFLSLAGLILGALLLWYEADDTNSILKEVCGKNKGHKIDCNTVLQSKRGTIFGFSWGILGFSYFSALLFAHLGIGLTQSNILAVSSLCSIGAATYIPFSLLYQWKIVKKWCTLCLMVQAILGMQLFLSVYDEWFRRLNPPAEIPIKEILTLITVGCISLIIANRLISLSKTNRELSRSNILLKRLKYNYDFFVAALSKQKSVNQNTDGLGIMLGNPDAKYKIIKVCNPYCGPCAKAHPIIEMLLTKSDVSIQIIFTASNDKGDMKAQVVKHLMAISADGNLDRTRAALDTWYNAREKNYEAFLAKYPTDEKLQQQDEKLKLMNLWCKTMEIQFTPTFFINGRQLPEMYSISDINYFLTL